MLGGCVTRSASRDSRSSWAASAARRAACCSPGTEPADQRLQREAVALRPEAAEKAHGVIGEQRVLPRRLAGEEVGEMDLDVRHLHRQERVCLLYTSDAADER